MTRLLLAATLVLAAALPVASASAAPYDFEGDGRADLAVGVPRWTGAGSEDGGAALVLPGSRRGVSLAEQLLFQPAAGGAVGPERGDRFGGAVASGDFDRDGHSDLALGAPGESTGGTFLHGAVSVLYGSPRGLTADRVQLFASTEQAAQYGAALAVGDLDRDGYADLVVSATGADPRPEEDYGSGTVAVLFGGPAGLSARGARTLARPRREDAAFGSAIALGDVDRDGHLDLVEGYAGSERNIDFEGVPAHASFCPGGAAGPTGCRPMGGGAASLAVGDVTGDRYPDVVQGDPVNRFIEEDGPVPPGHVQLWRGTPSGPSARVITITQNRRGVPGGNEQGDRFGAAVAVADLDRDGDAELVVGAPGEDRGAGRVTVLRGARAGHATRGNAAYDQDSRGVAGRKERDDRLGEALTLLDFTGDGRADLALGVPGENRGAGALTTLLGAPGLLTARRSQTFGLATLGRPDQPQVRFGSLLGRVASAR